MDEISLKRPRKSCGSNRTCTLEKEGPMKVALGFGREPKSKFDSINRMILDREVENPLRREVKERGGVRVCAILLEEMCGIP
jgi:hypothetical protein